MAPRVAFVTGASGGIGRALALRMAQDGVHVALAARRLPALREVTEEIAAAGGTARAYALDVRDPNAVAARVAEAEADLGPLDLVVANAGVAKGRWSGKLTFADCENTLDVNVRGAVATLLAPLPGMLARGRGRLVGISSISAYRGLPKFAAYSASKAFLSAFLEVLRVDLARTGVRVSDIRPGYVRTGMTGRARPPLIMSADAAAHRIWRAIERGRSVYAFPYPMAATMRTLRRLPAPIYDRVAARLLPG